MATSRQTKILHVTEASNAGVGGHIIDLMEGQPDLDCDVHLIYSPLRVDDFFRERIKGMSEELFTQVPMKRMPHWSDFAASRSIDGCISERGPFDIIHAHSTKAGGLCRIGKKSRAAKVVYTPNGIFSMNPTSNRIARAIVKQAERLLAQKSHAIIAVSPEEQQHMESIGIPAERIRMVPNGLRPINWSTRNLVRKQLGIDQEDLLFGFLGRLAPQKNPVLLVEAFAQIKDLPSARLAVVGAGNLEQECRELAAQLGIADRIYWLGYKTAQQAMPAFDVFVMPSRYEGMPYVMMEALSLGLPVIATPVGGTSLTVEHEHNGFVVPIDDASATAQAMRTLSETSVRDGMSKAALEKSKEFSVELMVQRTNDVYHELLEQKG